MIGYQLSVVAARQPHATALTFGARRYTYAQLNERACRLANGLRALRIGRGDRVATLVHNCNQFVEALFRSGITAGCNAAPPLYCPDQPLTRGQMAAFLAKGLGLQWPLPQSE